MYSFFRFLSSYSSDPRQSLCSVRRADIIGSRAEELTWGTRTATGLTYDVLLTIVAVDRMEYYISVGAHSYDPK